MDFSQSTKEALGFYVYCLVDPRDNRVFYIGKGKGNRVFDHVHCALEEDGSNLKLETIRAIHANDKEVKHYIIRHKLTQDEAYKIESTLIDFLTYPAFNMERCSQILSVGTTNMMRVLRLLEMSMPYMIVLK